MGNKNSTTKKEIITNDVIQWNDTVPFIVPLKKGRVIKVYDGDTITVAAKLPQIDPDTIFRFSVRIRGIDAPEIKTANEEEKQMALKARDALSKLVLNKEVTLENLSTEKYSRVLADVYCNNASVGEWMLNKRYAVEYDGSTKKSPQSWKKYFETGQRSLEVPATIMSTVTSPTTTETTTTSPTTTTTSPTTTTITTQSTTTTMTPSTTTNLELTQSGDSGRYEMLNIVV